MTAESSQMIKGLENLLYDEGLEDFNPFTLEKSRLRVDLTTFFQYSEGGYKEDRGCVFARTHMERTRGNRCKLHQQRSHLDKRIFSQ